ncbi:hypothetical protein AB0G97_09120 [Streptomyces sp. NPDC020755]|uniref:hypothetical protein n=1 Tax=Streptomyces sp. NPDC020755 TaxID=3154790 RepID=UPI0034067390
MSTETIGTTPQTAQPAWKRGLKQAIAATWKTIGIPTSAHGPIDAAHRDWEGHGDYAGTVHYLLLAPVREIAAAYDIPVTETTNDSGTTYSVVVPVDGISVTIWTTNPADAPATTSAVAE